ncbi:MULTISPECIES: arginine N-succinyltransferase [Sphingobium]|uniref:arginine N-succinyltransferase n=1 Tax=Sphingobium TaxID=165695 RepID=UPI000C406F60|nr:MULTISPECIES: arginine N-succinyltransferase [Sphingobium]MBS46800.1 arginine N-succinyltransferase [Sphingobium sp.]MEC9018272.1 arginine N-succinyltransferase [Pseudomonadota bacterium]MCC4257757.1 arginine N-succinyltransferase [Sphingobium lactosutens]MEE2741590.1 arginine N-succinyltransferase [Pseudomonadota bacterium]HCW62568.1 arginine N-succinyltransferase [Sphingobium sp.]
MSFIMRIARADDLQTLYEMAKLTGGGFTNLPPDRASLSAKLERTEKALKRTSDGIEDELIVMVLENVETGQVRGTCQIFSTVGQNWPFYSYRLGMLTQHSRELGRTFRAQMLSLTTDLEGSVEVGGLFLHPRERAEGLGLLLARSRYLYIRNHRARFGDRVIAELRGVIDEAGGSPFWDGLAGRFFGMSFQEADEFNAVNGNQFIADLMPKTPIYTAMLTDSARAVIGLPHPNGRAAMRMLETEGFENAGYVDIFDGGPTMVGQVDQLKTIAAARDVTLAATHESGGQKMLIACGQLADYRCTWGLIEEDADGAISLDVESVQRIGLEIGDRFTMAGRA